MIHFLVRSFFAISKLTALVFAFAVAFHCAAYAAERTKKSEQTTKMDGSGTSQTVMKPKPKTPSSPRLGGLIFTQVGSNFRQTDAPDHQASMSSTALLSYRISSNWQAISILGFSQQMTGEQRFRFRNTDLRAMYKTATLSEGISVLTGLNTVLPTNLDSRQLESLYLGVGLSNRLRFDLAAHGVPGLSGFYDLNLNRNFHEFDTAVSGAWNTQYELEHFGLAFYEISRYFGVMVTGRFVHQWDYVGTVFNGWGSSQELDFSPTKSIQIGLGHANGGSILNASGSSYRLRIFDPDDSTFYLSVNFAL